MSLISLSLIARVLVLEAQSHAEDLKLVKSSAILIFDEADVMLYEHSHMFSSLNQVKAKMLQQVYAI